MAPSHLRDAQVVDDLRRSRARLVAAAQRERLRLEAQLHDGAQQRLFAIQMRLRAARERGGDLLERSLEQVEDELAVAAAELVELANSLYPTVLRERGLGDGLRSAVRTAAVPVDVIDHGVPRLDPVIEEAVYRCVLEGIEHAARDGDPAVHVTVTLELVDGVLSFSIVDDGRGSRPAGSPDEPSALDMSDRIGAVGGRIAIEAEPGRGTIVRGSCSVPLPADALNGGPPAL
jgi:signal transduction histidine kinase